MATTIKEAFEIAEVLQCASPASLAALAAGASVRRLKKGEILFWDKADVGTLYIVISGMVSLYKINAQGEKKVVFVLGKGKMVNEVILQDLPASINCEVFEDAQILCIPKKMLLEIMAQDFDMTKAIIDSLSMKVRRLYRQMKNTSNSLRGDKRLAAKLWKLTQDYGESCEEGICINLDLSITYLADMLGSKRETVSRQLKSLNELGLVMLKAGKFIVTDTEKLSAYFKASENE